MYLKINRNKKAQILLEYVVLITMAILAIIAVNIMLRVKEGTEETPGFDTHFRRVAAPAGGVIIP